MDWKVKVTSLSCERIAYKIWGEKEKEKMPNEAFKGGGGGRGIHG